MVRFVSRIEMDGICHKIHCVMNKKVKIEVCDFHFSGRLGELILLSYRD